MFAVDRIMNVNVKAVFAVSQVSTDRALKCFNDTGFVLSGFLSVTVIL